MKKQSNSYGTAGLLRNFGHVRFTARARPRISQDLASQLSCHTGHSQFAASAGLFCPVTELPATDCLTLAVAAAVPQLQGPTAASRCTQLQTADALMAY